MVDLPLWRPQILHPRQVLLHDPEPPRKVNPNIHRDIETICLKAMQKKPAKRDPTAGAMAREVERFLNGEPIQARPATAWDRLRARVRHHHILAACLMGLVLGSIPAGWMVRNLMVERDRERQERERERKERDAEQEIARRVQEELTRRERAEKKRIEARFFLDQGRSMTGTNAEDSFGKAMEVDPEWPGPYLERAKLRINARPPGGLVRDRGERREMRGGAGGGREARFPQLGIRHELPGLCEGTRRPGVPPPLRCDANRLDMVSPRVLSFQLENESHFRGGPLPPRPNRGPS